MKSNQKTTFLLIAVVGMLAIFVVPQLFTFSITNPTVTTITKNVDHNVYVDHFIDRNNYINTATNTNITTTMPSTAVMMNYNATYDGWSNITLAPNGTVVDVAPSTEYVVPFTIDIGHVLKTINLYCQIAEGNYATLNCYIIPVKNFPNQLQTNWGNNLFRALVIQNNHSIPLQFTTYLEHDDYYICLESAGPAHFNFPLSNRNDSYPKYEYLNGTLQDRGNTLAIEYIYEAVTHVPGTQQIMNVASYTIRFSQGLSVTKSTVTLGASYELSMTSKINITLAYLNIKLNNDNSGSTLGSFTFGSNTANTFAISVYQFTPNSTTTLTITNATLYNFPDFKPYLQITVLFNGSASVITKNFSAYWDYDVYTAIPQTTFIFKVGHSIANLYYGDPVTPDIMNFTDTVFCFGLIDENIWETIAKNGWYDQVDSNVSIFKFYDLGKLVQYEYPNSYQFSFPAGYAILIVQCDNFFYDAPTYGNGANGGYAAPVWKQNAGNPSVLNNLVFGNQTTYICELNGFRYDATYVNDNGGLGDLTEVSYTMNSMLLLSDITIYGIYFDPRVPIF